MNAPDDIPPEARTQVARPATGRLRTLARMATLDMTPLRRHRDFRLLFIARAVSTFGSMITSVALPYQVFQLTHSSFAVGILGVFEIVAILLLAFLGGALADAHDRRRMVQFTEAAQAVLSAGLLVNTLLPHPRLWAIYLIATLMPGLDSLQRPSLDALLPRLVDRTELTAASALGSMRMTVAMIAGPALGGILIATVGLSSTYGIDVVTFGLSLVALSYMRAVPPPPDAERPSIGRVLEGLRYAWSRQELMGTYLVDMIAMFFGMPMALFPALAAHYGGAGALGFLYTAPAVGAFLASVTSGWSNHVHRHGLAIVVAAAVWGAAIIGFGFAGTLAVAFFFLAIAGGADMISGVFRSTIWNQTIPDNLRGRLASIELISYSSGPTLGNVESGIVASLVNVRASVVSGGVLCVAGVLLMAAALPIFVHYDSRKGAAAAASSESQSR